MSEGQPTSRLLRDSRVWKISLRDEEKAFLDAYVEARAMTLRQLVDDSLALALTSWSPAQFADFVLTSPGSARFSVRVDSELFESLLRRADICFQTGAGSPINSASILATAVWSYVKRHPVPELAAEFEAILSRQLRIKLLPNIDRLAS